MASPSARPKAAAAAEPGAETVSLPSGASYPAFLEPLTENETSLLGMYDTIRHYEREAARLKAEEAKRRLEEADERYRAKVRERELAEGAAGSGDEADDGERAAAAERGEARRDPDGSEEDEDETREDRERRSEQRIKISELRKDVSARRAIEERLEAGKEAARRSGEALRLELLGGDRAAQGEGRAKRPRGDDGDDDDGAARGAAGPSIKKKRADPSSGRDDGRPEPSLIANMGGSATPPHDFSKGMRMPKAGPDGSVLFPAEGNLPWSPPPRPADFLDGCLECELPDFDSSGALGGGNNTVAIKFHAPQDSPRFSINIALPGNDGYNDILFHFNPRHFKKGGQLVLNDRKETMWGNDLAVPLSTLPLMFGAQACTLVVQIAPEGFDVFVEGQHCARLEHRRPLPKGASSLFLQFPSSDDYGNPEDWMVYRVWWGRKPSMADDLNGVAGVNLFSAVHPKKLFVSNLSKINSDPEVDLRRAELERAFRKYGGPTGAVAVSIQKNSTFAFVELVSEAQADLALAEMTRSGKYRVNKARRTKHEALMEERAAKEASEGGGGVKETVDWD